MSCEDNFEERFNSLGDGKTSSEFYLSYRQRHPTRAKFLTEAAVLYNKNEVCKDLKACSNLCGKLFQYDFDQKDCRDLPVSLVNRFNFIYKTFENKNFKALPTFNLFDLKIFLSFSLEPSVRLFSKLGSLTAKGFLKQLASNWDIAQIFIQEDLDFILLETLLNEIGNEPIKALGETIESGASFQEIALFKQNDFAISFIHNFFKKLCNNEERCILNHYCLVSKGWDKKTLIELSHFKSLKEILQKHRGQNDTLQSLCPIL